jgi:hypothetical protein
MKIGPRPIFWLLVITPLSVCANPAPQLLLHEIFQDHAVLQRDQPIKVWGESSAGDRVSVSIDAKTVEARADASGQWHALLPPMRAGGPYALTVHTALQSDRVLLDASGVENATRVRYCWGDAPVCNLYDQSGLPAGPFETAIRN